MGCIRLKTFLATAFFLLPAPVSAETTECTEITTLPAVIATQGVYCLKQNLNTAATTGNAIDIQTNNVTIDLNGFKLGGLAAGPATEAVGIFAADRTNIHVRNGSIRGFRSGIKIVQGLGNSSGHKLEGLTFDGNTVHGAFMEGDGMTVQGNRFVNTVNNDAAETVTVMGLYMVANDSLVSKNVFSNVSDATSVASSHGIFINGSSNVLIDDNMISSVDDGGTGNSMGIYLLISDSISVRSNTIFDITGTTSANGIQVTSSSNTTILANQVLNSVTGTNGIYSTGGSTNTSCIANVVTNYTTALSGCDFESGNRTP